MNPDNKSNGKVALVTGAGTLLLLTLPQGMSGAAISRAALAENVLVVPGDDFHIQGGENTLRLNFSNCAPEMIKCGIQRLASLVKSPAL